MTVGTLQSHLRDLAGFLEQAGAGKQVVTDLRAVNAGLSPFAAATLSDFASFLARADEFARTGKVVGPVKPSRGRKAEPGPESPELAAARRRLADLYEQARHSTTDHIRGVVSDTTGGFTAAELKRLAEAVKAQDKVQRMTKKDNIVEAIRRAIQDRKDMADRSDQ